MSYRRFNKITKKKTKRKNWFFLFFYFFIFSLIVYFLFFSDFFKLKNTIIIGNNKIDKSDIIIEVQKETNSKKLNIINNNILLINIGDIKNNILSISPLISNVKINKKLPNSLEVSISERVGFATICSIGGELKQKCFVVDSEGFSFEKYLEDDKNLPIIISDSTQDLLLGKEIIEKKLLSIIISFYSKMEGLNVSLKNLIIVSEKRINAVTENNWEIYFNPEKSMEWQITKLNSVLSEMSDEKKDRLEYIELRFGNTVPFKIK